MSAQRIAQQKPSPVERPLVWLTELVLRYPLATLILGLVLAAIAMGASHRWMGFRTNRLDLLNPKSEFNRRWIEYVREFGDQEDVVVVVEGAERRQVVPVRDALAEQIAQNPQLFHSVLWRIDPSRLRAKGLYYGRRQRTQARPWPLKNSLSVLPKASKPPWITATFRFGRSSAAAQRRPIWATPSSCSLPGGGSGLSF